MYLAFDSFDGVSVEPCSDNSMVHISFPNGTLTLRHKDSIDILYRRDGVVRRFTNISATMTTLAIRRFIENPHLDSR